MRASRIAVAVAVFGLAGAARAESAVPGNYVDDFGSVGATSAPTVARSTVLISGSPIAANYVDDFGSLPPRSAPAVADGDDVGAGSGEPGNASRTTRVQSSEDEDGARYQQDRFVQAVWGQP